MESLPALTILTGKEGNKLLERVSGEVPIRLNTGPTSPHAKTHGALWWFRCSAPWVRLF